MIFKSNGFSSSVIHFNDTRDDSRMKLPEYDFYYPALPLVFSRKKFNFKGYKVFPGKLTCSCGMQGKVSSLLYDNLCEHLCAILLSEFSSSLGVCQKFLLELTKKGILFSSGILNISDTLYSFIYPSTGRFILCFDLFSAHNVYFYNFSSGTWKYGIKPEYDILLTKYLNNLTS